MSLLLPLEKTYSRCFPSGDSRFAELRHSVLRRSMLLISTDLEHYLLGDIVHHDNMIDYLLVDLDDIVLHGNSNF